MLTRPTARARRATKQHASRRRTQRRGEALLLLGPCALYLSPSRSTRWSSACVRSFQRVRPRADTWHWIGLGNYRELFTSDEFWHTVENTRDLHVRRRRDPGRVGTCARAVLQPEAARRRDRARDPDSADAADADRGRPDVAACCSNPEWGMLNWVAVQARASAYVRWLSDPARRDLDADPRRLAGSGRRSSSSSSTRACRRCRRRCSRRAPSTGPRGCSGSGPDAAAAHARNHLRGRLPRHRRVPDVRPRLRPHERRARSSRPRRCPSRRFQNGFEFFRYGYASAISYVMVIAAASG